ncbi:MAG: VanZ family protein [Tepidanaerobacteraceae bacterium]
MILLSQNKGNKTIIAWIAVLLWMGVIFYFSHQPALESTELSSKVTKIIINTLEKINPNAEIDVKVFSYIVRKAAHFSLYFVLGFLVINGLWKSGIYGSKGIYLGVFISLLYAISDEVHQLYVPGRGGQVQDVILDTVGSVVGILLYVNVFKERLRNNRVRYLDLSYKPRKKSR